MTETANVAGNYALSGGEGDPGFVAERLDDIKQERQERRAEQVEFDDVKSRLEEKRERQRRIVDVMDEPVEFEPVGGGVASDALDLRQRVMNDDPGAEQDLIELVYETLAENSVDPGMTGDWWRDFPMPVVQRAFEELVMSDLSEQERAQIEEFRGE